MSLEMAFMKNKASVSRSALKSEPATALNTILSKDVSASCSFCLGSLGAIESL
jgi:hypothetical protein